MDLAKRIDPEVAAVLPGLPVLDPGQPGADRSEA